MEIISLKEDASSAKPTSSAEPTKLAKPTNSANAQIITAMKPAVKNENRVNIYVDDKYDFSLDIAQVVDLKIKIGKRLSEEELNKLRQASEFGILYQRALEKTLSRPHSIKEIRDYLKNKRSKRLAENKMAIENRKKDKELIKRYRLKVKEQSLFSDEDIEKIISQLIKKGYLDDQKFAEYFVENRNQKKGESIKKLKLELVKKGINQNIITRALENSDRSDEEEIKKIIKKKRQRYDDEKLIQYLARQGFDYQLAKSLVQSYQEQD